MSAFAVVEDLAHCLPEHVDRLAEEDARLLRAPPRDGTIGPARIAGALLHLLEGPAATSPCSCSSTTCSGPTPVRSAALCVAVGRLGQEPVAVVPRPDRGPRSTPVWRPGSGTRWVRWRWAMRLPCSASAWPSGTAHRDRRPAGDGPGRGLGRCPLALVEAGRLLTPSQLAGEEPLPDPLPLGARLDEAWGRTWLSLPESTRTAVLALAVTQGGAGRHRPGAHRPRPERGRPGSGGGRPAARTRAGRARRVRPRPPAHPRRHPGGGRDAGGAGDARAGGRRRRVRPPPSVVIAHVVAAAPGRHDGSGSAGGRRRNARKLLASAIPRSTPCWLPRNSPSPAVTAAGLLPAPRAPKCATPSTPATSPDP